MPRMTIYVSDALKAEMDLIGDDRVNWSNSAQRAFEREVDKLKWPKEPTMEAVIERLRASKAEQFETAQDMGIADGKAWAMKDASFAELKVLAGIHEDFEDYLSHDDAASHVRAQMKARMDDEDYEIWEEDNNQPEPAYVRGYLKGAAQVWEEVEGQL